MPNFLEMLNQSQQQSAQVMGLASEQISALANLQMQQKEFEAQETDRAFRRADTQRRTESLIQTRNLQNAIRQEEFEFEQKMQPLRYEEAKFSLEARKAQARRQTRANIMHDFNSITAPYDQEATRTLIDTQNKDFFRDYQDYKSRWRQRARQGEDFDEVEYDRGLESLRKKYEGKKVPDTGYDPEFSRMLGDMGANVARKRYEAKNPQVSKSMTGIKLGMLNATDAQFANMASKHSESLDERDFNAIIHARDAIQSYEAEIKRGREQLEELRGQYPSIEEAPEEMQAYHKDVVQDIVRAQRDRREVSNNIIQNTPVQDPYRSQEDLPPNENTDRRSGSNRGKRLKEQAEQEENQEETGQGSVDDSDAASSFSSFSRENIESQQRVNDVENIRGKFTANIGREQQFDPIKGIESDFFSHNTDTRNWFEKIFTSQDNSEESQERNRMIAGRVIGNINELSADELVSLAESVQLDDIINTDIDATTRVEFGDQTFHVGKDTLMNTDVTQQRTRGSYGYETHFAIRSREDLMEIMREEGLSETQRRRRFIRGYASLVTAALRRAETRDR